MNFDVYMFNYALIKMAGEWFKADTEAVISQALQTGGGPNVSDAYTINGLLGPLYNCSANGIHIFLCPLIHLIEICVSIKCIKISG